MIYDKDEELDAYPRKAPKLSYKSLHPGNNKHDINMAIAIFHESTVAASQYYFSRRPDMANFMKVIWTWWTIANSRQQCRRNALANAISNHDDKMEFYLKLADWQEFWTCSNFCLSKQTSKTLVLTLRSQAMRIKK